MKNFCKFITKLILLLVSTASSAAVVELSVIAGENINTTGSDLDTQVLRADLTGIDDLDVVGSVTIRDDGSPTGGGSGVFSGFDLDAVFLDRDGSLATTADRFFPTSYIFSAGSTRPTADPTQLPTAEHPGPTFGSIDATTIDFETASLNELDAFIRSSNQINTGDGWLTLGDNGQLIINFSEVISTSEPLTLILGEVGGQPGEGLGASISVSSSVVPLPASIYLFTSGVLGVFAMSRGARTKSNQG
jgi:hypothetical protein